MKFETISSTENIDYAKARELYKISFPLHEQRMPDSQDRILAHPEYNFSLIYDAGNFVGEALYWETSDFIYVEHLCISPEMRNKNYGAKALKLFLEKNKTVILEIDPPVDEISIRRKGFYERCGFKSNKHAHVHPPYRQGFAGHELVIMTAPEVISPEQYEAFACYLKDVVMSEVFTQST